MKPTRPIVGLVLRLLGIGMLLGACMCTPSARPTPRPAGHVTEAAALTLRTVALVRTLEDEEIAAYCSGVWVSADVILTANHCVHRLALLDMVDYVVRADIADSTDATTDTHGAILIARDEANDLALARALVPPPHTWSGVALDPPRVGMFVQTMGQPLGLWWSYSSGEVSALRMIDGTLFVQTTAPISPGNSGGALFDEAGAIVGICHGAYLRGQNLNLFIHPAYVAALIQRHLNNPM